MPKPNYQFEKRQRELAKKAKKAEKAARKSSGRPDDAPADDQDPGLAPAGGTPAEGGEAGSAAPPDAGRA
ncbi:MAG TPA: hypothetical protein VEA81_03925 [Burkholderiaceae bacterium]|nr:hypothetical protein [Burkholderiaceae bacterium]